MAKVTSKLQVTIPKAIADECGIVPGDHIQFIASGESIRVVRENVRDTMTAAERLALFDRATARQRARQSGTRRRRRARGRGWTRADLYDRGRPR
ncbi:MAG: AbrB/MazE/SpoVT family DNA-binding domain-containing protein [Gemmatimonadaceae bacterium]